MMYLHTYVLHFVNKVYIEENGEHDVVEAHLGVVDIRQTDSEQIRM